MRGGSYNRGSSSGTMIMIVVVMLVCMSSIMMCTMGPLGGLFSGASSLLGGAGDLVGGAASGAGKAASGLGSVLSGEVFKGPSLERVADFKSGVCQDCANKNWTGSVTAFGKPVECSAARSRC